MEIVKILERKSVIRFFGIGLVLSPFFNTFLTIMTFAQVQDRWSWRIFWFVTTNRALVDQLLYVATFTIGILMLRGAPWVWKCLLVLLGGYILNQTMHFGPNFRANKLSAVFFLMNVAVFLFIADQLAWKVKKHFPKAETKDLTKPIPEPQAMVMQKEISPRTQLRSSKKHFVHFFKFGAVG